MYETVWTLPKGMRRYGEPSKDQERLVPLLFCSDCIIATRVYDFRKDRWSVGYFYHADADKWSDADTLLFHVTLAALKFHALPADFFLAAARLVGRHS
jgi:hypothetical protein